MTVADPIGRHWVREAIAWPRLVLVLILGFVTRVVLGLACSLLSVEDGVAGIATLAVMYVLTFDKDEGSLIGVALSGGTNRFGWLSSSASFTRLVIWSYANSLPS